MNPTAILIIFLAIWNSGEATPTHRGLRRLGHHREDFTQDPSRNDLANVDECEPKEAGGNLQEEQEQDQRQVVKEVEGLLRQLRQLGRWTVKVKSKTARDDETFGQNWVGSEMEPRDLRAGLRSNSHGTLISKGW